MEKGYQDGPKNWNGKISNDNNEWMLLKLKELDVCKKTEWLLKGICQGIATLICLIRPRILPLAWQVQNLVVLLSLSSC